MISSKSVRACNRFYYGLQSRDSDYRDLKIPALFANSKSCDWQRSNPGISGLQKLVKINYVNKARPIKAKAKHYQDQGQDQSHSIMQRLSIQDKVTKSCFSRTLTYATYRI